MEKHLHIICFDVPYPADYGGAIEVFCKVRALFEAGIKIHLHCFEYGRGRHQELQRYCVDVEYYTRKTGHKGVSTRMPYIVASRMNEELHENLLADEYPILLEGIHCTSILFDPRFNHRHIFLRLHNVEYVYYYELFKSSKSLLKKVYYNFESRLLKKYEAALASGIPILALSETDIRHYIKEFEAENIRYLPAFIPSDKITAHTGTGCFCLYHGNLSVPENEKAALFLLKHVFNELKTPFVIAGKNPSRKLIMAAEKSSHTCIVSNPSDEEMLDLIRKAQINVLPSFNKTGIKLKLLTALFNGRHCITNDQGITTNGLASVCLIANDEAAMMKKIKAVYEEPFSAEHLQKRTDVLRRLFSNKASAEMLIRLIW